MKYRGNHVVGFGDETNWSFANPPRSEKVIMSTLAGISAGAVLGNLVKHGKGAAVGAVLGGGVAGVLMYAVTGTSPAVPSSTPTVPATPAAPAAATSTPWQRISDLSGIKSGQQIAMAITGPYGVPIPQELISQFDAQLAALLTAPVNLPTANFAKYPPGSQLPSDWPKDDDLGAGAYRVTADVVAAPPPEAASFKLPPPSVGNMKIWTRTK